MSARIGIFAKMLTGRRNIGGVCCFWVVKSAEKVALSVKLDFALPTILGLEKSYTLIATRIIRAAFCVSEILPSGSWPDFRPRIVRFIQTFMVNIRCWPFSCHIEDRKSMGLIRHPVYENRNIASWSKRPCYISWRTFFPLEEPSEHSRIWVIRNNLLKALKGDKIVVNHDVRPSRIHGLGAMAALQRRMASSLCLTRPSEAIRSLA